MPLPEPAARRHLHTRTIRCEGYARDDGLWDIEARIVDTKTYQTEEPFRGMREPGKPVHHMQVRLTLDRDMVVRDIDVTTNDAPYDVCPTVAPNYKALIGARVGAGWRRAVTEAVGRTKGCTHITELLMPMATVAFQTMGSWPKPESGSPVVHAGKKPYFVDGCAAWASDGPVVKKLFPIYYRGSA